MPAAIELARVWCGWGRRKEARDLLAPVCSWFTEGFGTRDLREARALVDQLGQFSVRCGWTLLGTSWRERRSVARRYNDGD